jgi:hypothetical protein
MQKLFKSILVLAILSLMAATGLSAGEKRSVMGASIQGAGFSGSYASISFPAWVKHGQFRDTNFTIENNGDDHLTYTVQTYETTGRSGWLGISGFSGVLLWDGGGSTFETGQFRLNVGGIINTPGTIVQVKGGVVFTSNAPSSPDTIPVSIFVVDTVISPDWDSIYVKTGGLTNLKGLTVSRIGSFGHDGLGGVNLDFSQWGDCDSTADVYLNNGSVTVGYVSALDTNMFWSSGQNNYLAETGLLPITGPKPPKKKDCTTQKFSLVYSGRFTTHDSDITMEKTWYAPILSGTGTNDSSWMIQCLKVWNTSGSTKTGVVIGEIADWNVPSDSGFRNSSNFNPVKNLIYQQGGEFDDVGECQDNDARFGAVRYLGGRKNNTNLPNPSGAFTREIASDVVPTGDFVEADLFTNMQSTGYSPSGSVSDLYTVMTFAKNQTLGVTDTFRFYTAWLSVRNADTTALFTMSDRANNWFGAKGIANLNDTVCVGSCCRVEGDFDHNGVFNVVDLTKYVQRMFQGGPAPVCYEEADYNDSGTISVVDLTAVVARLFQGGPFAPCP